IAASRMVSEIWSAILSGWPSVTDSEVKRWDALSFWSSAAFQAVIPTVFSAILYSPRFRLKSSPPPFYVSRSHGGERPRRSGPSTHLSESPPQEWAPATRLDDKPRRLPRFHRARPSTALDERRRSPGVFGWKLHHVRQTNAMPDGQNLLRVPP